MKAEETRRRKAKEMRYKKPIVKDLNLFSITQYLGEIQEKCSDVRWYYETDEDTLINALDGDEDEAFEFKMMFSNLDAECEQMRNDLDEWMYADGFESFFDLFFVAMGAGDDYGGLLGYDSYSEDYFGIENYSDSWIEDKSREKLERMTKKDIIEMARWSFRIYQSYIALRYRYDCLEASMNILRDQNTSHLQMVKELEDLYEKADRETSGFRFLWKGDAINKLEAAINNMPPEAWLS